MAQVLFDRKATDPAPLVPVAIPELRAGLITTEEFVLDLDREIADPAGHSDVVVLGRYRRSIGMIASWAKTNSESGYTRNLRIAAQSKRRGRSSPSHAKLRGGAADLDRPREMRASAPPTRSPSPVGDDRCSSACRAASPGTGR